MKRPNGIWAAHACDPTTHLCFFWSRTVILERHLSNELMRNVVLGMVLGIPNSVKNFNNLMNITY